MGLVQLLSVVLLLGSPYSAHAAIGPVADLHITNANISPDGYSRAAILAGGSYPGPLIRAKKVHTS